MNYTKLIAVFLLILLVVAFLYWWNGYSADTTGSDDFKRTGICTEEARICDDGTTVIRSGPKCEYAPCP